MHRILFDCERMKYPDTGLYHYCSNLGTHLEKNINLHTEEIFFYSPGHERQWSFRQSNHINQNSLHKFWMPQLDKYQIWHATYQNTNYLPARNKKIKVVLSIHDLNFMYDEKKSAAKKQKYLAHVQRIIDRANAIVCISEFSRQDIMKHCDTGVKPLYCIYNGTNMLQQPELSLKSYKPKRPFLFTIGVIHRKKNFHVLLPLLKKNSMELLIAGKPDDDHYISLLENEAKKMGVDEHVHLLGNVSEKEKSWYYYNCCAFALPSISEGFGMPVAEAMSCGKPLFLSNKTALPEIGGDVSFYFKDFNPDHMNEVFETGMKSYNSNKLSARIQERGRNFNWDRAAKQYLEVYRTLY